MVEIEDDIPMPIAQGRVRKYPFDELKTGQSFIISAKSYALVSVARKKFPDRKFETRKVENGVVRVWRTA